MADGQTGRSCRHLSKGKVELFYNFHLCIFQSDFWSSPDKQRCITSVTSVTSVVVATSQAQPGDLFFFLVWIPMGEKNDHDSPLAPVYPKIAWGAYGSPLKYSCYL